jgi:hypothetical protein
MTESFTYGQPVDMIFSLDLARFLPHFHELQALHEKLFRKPPYNRVGPGSVLDDIAVWIVEATKKMYDDPSKAPEGLSIPNLTSMGKKALLYEELFLKTALSVWRVMPRQVHRIFPVVTHHDKTIFMIAYSGDNWKQYENVACFTVDDFSRTAIAKRKRELRKACRKSVP